MSTTTRNYALRLQASIMDELRKVVEREGTTLNQFINVAVAEKLATLRTADYFRERAGRADRDWLRDFLETGGGDDTPRAGDEQPEGGQDR